MPMKNLFLALFCWSFLWIGCSSNETPEKVSPPAPTAATDTPPAASDDRQHILFFGNSLTAAYGIDPDSGFVSRIQQRLDSLGWPYQTINSGNSCETTAGGNSLIEWVLSQQDFDVFILELGGNDGLRGIAPTDSYRNLKSIIDKVLAADSTIQIVLAGMEAPPNLGSDFTTAFRKNYRQLAAEYELPLIPFLLEGVGGIPRLNLPDGIHPTPQGHRIVADNIWAVLRPLLAETATR